MSTYVDKDRYKDVQTSFNHNKGKLETTQMSVKGRKDKKLDRVIQWSSMQQRKGTHYLYEQSLSYMVLISTNFSYQSLVK